MRRVCGRILAEPAEERPDAVCERPDTVRESSYTVRKAVGTASNGVGEVVEEVCSTAQVAGEVSVETATEEIADVGEVHLGCIDA